jgi:hypothetical protein
VSTPQDWHYDEEVNLTIDLDREEDGRWIAEALELPGVMCSARAGRKRSAMQSASPSRSLPTASLTSELPSSALGVSFTISDEQLARQ